MNTTMEPTTDRFHRYTLTGLLDEGAFLVEDTHLLVFTVWNEREPLPVAQEMLTYEESRIFRTVLAHSPYHCPYESLYAMYYDVPIEKARNVLHASWDTEEWEIQMKPIRNVLSRARIKVRRLGIEMSNVSETGYTCIPVSAGIHHV